MERRTFKRAIILPDGKEVERSTESIAEADKQLAAISLAESKKQERADAAAEKAAQKAAQLEAKKKADSDTTTTDK